MDPAAPGASMIDGRWLAGAALVLAAAFLIDRLLLRLEERQWINYRRHGLSRGAAGYHMLELSAVFDPGKQQVLEAEYAERKEEDDSGAPPAPGERDP